MGVYESYFSTTQPFEDGWLVDLICKGNYYLSYGFFMQLTDLESFEGDSDWSGFRLTKQDIEDFEYDEFNEDDWWFIRTVCDCLRICDMITIDIWHHIYLYVKG